MNLIIANMIRTFHAIFWFVLFCGILFSSSIQIVYISTFLIVIAVLLWSILGSCFVSVLEDGFDPMRLRSRVIQTETPIDDNIESVGAAFDLFSSWTRIDPKYFVLVFSYFIYFAMFLGLLKIYCFINLSKQKFVGIDYGNE